MIKWIIPFAHQKISEYVNKEYNVIDATCGNGHDTLFLSSLAHHVYAFDIQKSAIESSIKLLVDEEVSNVTFINDSHSKFDSYDLSNIKGIIYNLGYLPGSDKSVTTKYQTTIQSISKGLDILLPNGLMIITIYRGHEEGNLESDRILEYTQTLSSKHFNVLKYEMLNKKNSPYNILIEKLR